MALSPKSNSAVSSIDKVLNEIMSGVTPKIPNHLINVANYEDKEKYIYPHSYKDALVYQQYLPDELINNTYYSGLETGKYERALKDRNKLIKTVLKKKK